MESKRKFKRFDLRQGVKFRPTYGATEYSTGVVRNLSSEGLGLDAHDFRFIMFENLELIIDVPGNGDPVFLSGDILWKKQDGQRCLAGIKFRMKDKIMQEAAIGKIFASSNIPANYMYNNDFEYIVHEGAAKKSLHGPDGQNIMPPGPPNKLGFIRQYHENGAKCTVTFRLLREMAKDARNVSIVGDFNDWDESKSIMSRLANGDFVITMELESKREFRFRYLIDGQRWENDWYADRFVRNGKGAKYSVIIV